MSSAQPSSPETVLVTGASSGIGKEIAREFAKRGCSVIIVAPVAVELRIVAEELAAETGSSVRTIAKDLRTEDGVDEIFAELEEAGVTIDVLVNNAGLGYRGNFWELSFDQDAEMLDVNVRAPLRLTKLFLPGMITRGHGRILNTASIAGFEPGPLLAVYHATKAFLLSWSEALATELKDTGVTVTALCPGPVDTDFFVKADMLETRAFQEANVMGPREVAKAGVEAALRGERVVVPGGMNKVSAFSRRLTGESVQARKNEALYHDVPLEKHKRERGDVEAKEAAKSR